jgi:hypothetical protein
MLTKRQANQTFSPLLSLSLFVQKWWENTFAWRTYDILIRIKENTGKRGGKRTREVLGLRSQRWRSLHFPGWRSWFRPFNSPSLIHRSRSRQLVILWQATASSVGVSPRRTQGLPTLCTHASQWLRSRSTSEHRHHVYCLGSEGRVFFTDMELLK